MAGSRNLGRRWAAAAAAGAAVAGGLLVAVLAPVGGPRPAMRGSAPAAAPFGSATTAVAAPATTAASSAATVSEGPAAPASAGPPGLLAPVAGPTREPGPTVGAATVGAAPVGPAPTAPVVATDTVVHTGSLTLQVGKGGFGRAFSAAASIARDEGGFVVTAEMGSGPVPLPAGVGASTTVPPSGDVGSVGPANSPTTFGDLAAPTSADPATPTAGTLVMRVPGARFDDARRRLEALGGLQGEQLSGQDAGGQLADLAARIDDLRAEQDGLRAMAARATSTADLLQIDAQLAAVHQQLDGLLAQQAELGNQVALASITLTMSEPPPPPPAPRAVLDVRARQAGRALEAVAGGTLVALAYGGPAAILAALAAALVRGSRRRRAAMG